MPLQTSQFFIFTIYCYRLVRPLEIIPSDVVADRSRLDVLQVLVVSSDDWSCIERKSPSIGHDDLVCS